MKKSGGLFGGLDSQSGLDPRRAAQLINRTMMVAAKNTTAIAYMDALSQTGRDWLTDLGMGSALGNEAIVYNGRILLWNGTPYLTVDDLGQCLSLVDQYNEFEPDVVLRSLRSLVWRHPQYKFTFVLAREFSPAIYFRDENFHRLDEIELANLGAELKADDANYTSGGDHRLWWD